MAQNVTIAGASYPDVPSITVPKTDGGSAVFVDTSDADAAADDIASGKKAYVNGELVTGTGTGGSGNLQTKTVTGNGTYTPDEGYDGFSQVEVAVSNLLAENIRRCASVGDVEGSYFQPEIWVFNEEITFPGTISGAISQFDYTGLSFLSPALFDLTTTIIGNVPSLAIGHTLRLEYVKAKDTCRIRVVGETVAYSDIDITIPAGNSVGSYIRHMPGLSHAALDKTTGWWGKFEFDTYPQQIGRVIVFLKPPEGDFRTWLQANATFYQGVNRSFFTTGDLNDTTSPFDWDPLFQLIESAAAMTERGTEEITENGKHWIYPAAPYAAMKYAAVNVNVPVPALQESKAVTITSNGTTNVTPDDGYDGVKSVAVTVNVAEEEALPVVYINNTGKDVKATICGEIYTLAAGTNSATPLDGNPTFTASQLLSECTIQVDSACVLEFHVTTSAIVIHIYG